MSIDLTPLLFGQIRWEHEEAMWISLIFGLVMLVAAYLIDRRVKDDYAFWGYLFGLMAFWNGLSWMAKHSEWVWLLYLVVNLALMMLSLPLTRPAFIVFGALGVMTYLGHLAWDIFKDSLMFPFALSSIGIIVIFATVKYQEFHKDFETRAAAAVPPWLRRLLPSQRIPE